MVADSVVADAREFTGKWGWFLAAGIVWVIFGFVVLSFNMATVWAIAVFFGIGFIAGGVMELAVAAVSPGWKWLYILIGIVSIVAGIMALVWPGETFLVLAAIVGWLLFFYGIIDIVFAIGSRDNSTVATWRGTVLLVFWVGIAAIMRGISDIVIGFRLRSARKELERAV